MGHRVMEMPNLHGKTAPRHLVPRAVRRSRKRAFRAAVKSPTPVKPVQRQKREARVESPQLAPSAVRRNWKQALGIAAKAQEPVKAPELAQPEPTSVVVVGQPLSTPVQPSPKPEIRIAAKVQTPAKPPKRAMPPKSATPPKSGKSPQESETEVMVEAPKTLDTDRLKDGVVEWGIKREDDSDSEA